MKLIKLLTITACAFALVAGSAFAQEKAKKTCCEKAKAKGEACSHPCCVEAAKEKKVCEKCNPKKEKKEEAK
jgi:hypothetical protein